MALSALLAGHLLIAVETDASAAMAAPATPTVGCDTHPEIFNTGIDVTTYPSSTLPNNTPDAHWEASQAQLPGGAITLAANAAQYPASTVPFAPAVVGKAAGAWIDSSLPNANWISERRAAQSPGNTFYYRYVFTLDPRVEPSQFSLDMHFYADNSVPEVWVNGVPQSQFTVNLPQNATNPFFYGGFRAGTQSDVSLAEGWQSGLNEIMVQVASAPTHQGFFADASASVVCGPDAVDDERPPVDPGQSITPFDPLDNDDGGSTPITPSSLTLDQSTSVGGTFTLSGGLVRFTADDLSFSGLASINYSIADERGVSDTARIIVPVNAPAASLLLRMAATPPVVAAANEGALYTFEVTNTGNVPLSSVTVEATAFSGSGTAPEISCPLDAASLVSGESVTCQASYTVTQADMNTGYVSSAAIASARPPVGPPVTATDTALLTLSPTPEFTLSKASSASVVSAGGAVTYTITVQNTGNVDYTADNPVSFAADLAGVLDDGSLAAVPDAATVIDDVLRWEGPLAVADAVTVEYTVVVNEASNLGDGVLLAAVAPGRMDGRCLPQECETLTGIRAFTVSATTPTEAVNAGEPVSYTIEVENTGSVPYTNLFPAVFTLDLVDVVDDATYNDDASGGGALVESSLGWAVSLEPGQTTRVRYSVTARAAGSGDGRMTSMVLPNDELGGACAEEGACVTDTPVRSYRVSMSVDASETSPGEVLRYRIVVTNTGQADYTLAHPAALVANLSEVLDDATYGHDANNGAVYSAEELAWRGALAMGESVTITHTIRVNDVATGDGDLVEVVITPADGSCGAPTLSSGSLGESSASKATAPSSTPNALSDGCASISAVSADRSQTSSTEFIVPLWASVALAMIAGLLLVVLRPWRAMSWSGRVT